jgi:hypothetical protein
MHDLRWDDYVWILAHHLGYLGRNDFTLLTPRCCTFEDGDAFVHDGFEVFSFGVEGRDFGRRHSESVCVRMVIGGL